MANDIHMQIALNHMNPEITHENVEVTDLLFRFMNSFAIKELRLYLNYYAKHIILEMVTISTVI